MSNNRRRRRGGARVSGNPQRRAAQQERPRTSGPDPDRIRQLEEELRIARQAEEIEFDERLDDELDDDFDDGYEDDEPEDLTPRPRRRPRPADQDKPKFLHFKGQTFRLAGDPQGWDLNTAVAFEEGRMASALKGILGANDWAQICSLGAKLGDLEDLAQQISAAYGFDAVGESRASSS